MKKLQKKGKKDFLEKFRMPAKRKERKIKIKKKEKKWDLLYRSPCMVEAFTHALMNFL